MTDERPTELTCVHCGLVKGTWQHFATMALARSAPDPKRSYHLFEAAPSTDEGEARWVRDKVVGKYAIWKYNSAEHWVHLSLEAAIRAPLEERIRALQTTDYRCEEMCEAAQYGGSCRCSHLSNEIPAAEERIRELEAELNGTVATYMETTGDMGAEVLELRAEVERLREALRAWLTVAETSNAGKYLLNDEFGIYGCVACDTESDWGNYAPSKMDEATPVIEHEDNCPAVLTIRLLATPPSSTEGTK